MKNRQRLLDYRSRAQQGLDEVLDFYFDYALDPRGGVYGKVDRVTLQPDPDAERSLVLTARMLWTYAAAYRLRGDKRDLLTAYHMLDYITKHFLDPIYGGAYWGVNADGTPADTRKYVYGQAFLIYGGAELMRASGEMRGLQLALMIRDLLDTRCEDKANGGYYETYARDWTRTQESFNIPDPALGSKALNTHLHLIEAYTNLYRVWPTDELRAKLGTLLDIMSTKLLDTEAYHYKPYMTDEWGTTRSLFSFGHDIEGAWLLVEAAQAYGDAALLERVKPIALRIADACLDGLDEKTGGMYAEFVDGAYVKDMHWWVQAEAVVGFFNAYELTGDEKYLAAMDRVWDYIDNVIIDREGGVFREWLPVGDLPKEHEKNAFPVYGWKTPYHNGRMYMEMIERIDKLLEE